MAAPVVTWHEINFNESNQPTPAVASSPALPIEGGMSKLNFGAVQAGKATEVKCVVAKFAGTSVQNMKFWLDSRSASLAGSQNQTLSEANGWSFYSYIRKRDASPVLNHTHGNLTNSQKIGTEALPTGENFAKVRDSEEAAQFNDMKVSSVAAGDYSPYIYLSISTPVTANDGITDGFSYRMSFLYP